MKRSGRPTRKASLKNSELRRNSPLRSSGKPGRKPRKASETVRIYGSDERIEFVKLLPCEGCGIEGFSENAHVCGNGGTGRKADYTTIAPLCGRKGPTLPGCHFLFDEKPWEFRIRFPDFDPIAAAAQTEAAWQATLTREVL